MTGSPEQKEKGWEIVFEKILHSQNFVKRVGFSLASQRKTFFNLSKNRPLLHFAEIFLTNGLHLQKFIWKYEDGWQI